MMTPAGRTRDQASQISTTGKKFCTDNLLADSLAMLGDSFCSQMLKHTQSSI